MCRRMVVVAVVLVTLVVRAAAAETGGAGGAGGAGCVAVLAVLMPVVLVVLVVLVFLMVLTLVLAVLVVVVCCKFQADEEEVYNLVKVADGEPCLKRSEKFAVTNDHVVAFAFAIGRNAADDVAVELVGCVVGTGATTIML